MKLSSKDLKVVLLEWIDKVVLPSASPIQTFAITFAIGQMNGKIDEYLDKAKIFMDSEGNLDITELEKNARTALHKAGGKITIPYLDWIFDEEDLQKLIQIAKEHGHD